MTFPEPRDAPPVPDKPSLANQTARRALLSGGVEIGTKLLAMVLSAVAARQLGPSEVGVLGVVATIVSILSVLQYFWETAAVVGRTAPLSRALAATIARTIMATMILLGSQFLSPLAAARLTTTTEMAGRFQDLGRIMLSTLLIEALSTYPRVHLLLRLELSFLTRLQLINVTIYVAVGLTMILLGWNSLGLAWAQLLAATLTGLLLWTRSQELRWPGWPNVETFREIVLGTVRLSTGGFLGFLGTRTDNLIVAGAIGERGMSFYSLAYNMARLPQFALERAVSFVLVPTLVGIRDDSGRRQRAVDQTLFWTTFLAAPAGLIVYLCAAPATSIVLGERWLPVVPCLQIMAWSTLFAPLMFVASALVTASGRGQWLGLPSLGLIAFQLAVMPPLARRFGPQGAAFADLGAVCLVTFITWLAARLLEPDLRWRIAAAAGIPLVTVGVGATSGWLASLVWTESRSLVPLAFGLGAYVTSAAALGGAKRLRDGMQLLAPSSLGSSQRLG